MQVCSHWGPALVTSTQTRPCFLELHLLPWMEPVSNSHTAGNPWPLSSVIPAQCCSLANKFVPRTPRGVEQAALFLLGIHSPHPKRAPLGPSLYNGNMTWPRFPNHHRLSHLRFQRSPGCLTVWRLDLEKQPLYYCCIVLWMDQFSASLARWLQHVCVSRREVSSL